MPVWNIPWSVGGWWGTGRMTLIITGLNSHACRGSSSFSDFYGSSHGRSDASASRAAQTWKLPIALLRAACARAAESAACKRGLCTFHPFPFLADRLP